MKIKSYKFKWNDIYLVPIGDIHMGEKAFDKESYEKLMGYIKWIKGTPNAFAFLMGDLINCATIESVSSPFQQNMSLADQLDKVVKLLSPIKDKILGAITGNHEARLERYCGYNPTISICDRLGIYYFENSGIIILRMGCRKGKTGLINPRASFTGYAHHTTGGGATIGGKINRGDKLRQIVCDADFYLGAHNHMLGCIHTEIFKIDDTEEKIETIRQMIIDTGGYLNYSDSYAEQKMLPPVKIGSPRIHLILKRKGHKNERVIKDIHVSL